MRRALSLRGFPTAAALPIIAALFALAIFSVDTFTRLGVAVAVLYVVVILLAASFFQRRGLLLVALGCVALTLLSYALSHGEVVVSDALIRCVMSLSAIGITTLLALRNQTASRTLRGQAELLDLAHDMILVRDMNDVITYWNRGAEELYGWPRELAVGRVAHELLKTIFPVALAEIMAGLLRAGRWEGELIHTKRNGERVTVASRWSLQRDERGRPAAIMEINSDITERNRTQEALHRAQVELAHVTRVVTLGELTASIAHEVNQPLAAIVTNGEAGLRWLRREPLQLDEVRGAMERMIADGRRASQVIWRLRALSRKTDPQKTPLDLNEVIGEAVALVQREVRRHRVTLRLEQAPSLPPVLGDRIQLQQVLINLMVNAIQAMAATENAPRELTLRAQPFEAGQVAVAVQDSGGGIAPEDARRLFDAFFTTKPEGMGMGLSICRSIVEAHGGRIWVTANDGRGSTFHFTLPASEGPLPAQPVLEQAEPDEAAAWDSGEVRP